MRISGWPAVVLPLLYLPFPAAAQSGTWRVDGNISGRGFVIDCRFDEQGTGLGGVCTEIDQQGRPGRKHILSRGSVRGQSMRWTYPTKVMLMSIDIDFSGTVNGAGMTGTITAKGRDGTFTATRR